MKLWKFLLLMALLVGTGSVLLLGINFLLLPTLIHGNQVVTMPDLQGLSPEQAQQRLVPLQLEVKVDRTKPHPTVPTGMILDQTPAPEARIRGGRIVRVVLSDGPPAGSLPALEGLSVAQAEVTLQRENYRLGRVVRLQRPGVTQPVVAYQSPVAATMLLKGQAVDLVVAEPAPETRLLMPDMAGKPLIRARQVITAAGLVLAPVEYRRTDRIEPNRILEQDPPPGVRVRPGDRIELVASSR